MRRDLLNPTLKKVLEMFKLDKDYVSGQGAYLQDEKGNSYLDFISQYGAIPFGYNPEEIWAALKEAHHNKLPSLVQPSLPGKALELANLLADNTLGELCYCTFCQSGTEAVEAAIKLVRSTTGRKIIISANNSFHGKTLGALSATGKDSYQSPFNAPAPDFIRTPYNDIHSLNELFAQYSQDIAGIILEPIQGEGGIIEIDPAYLQKARELCDLHNSLLILDEVQTGLGRTGKLFACEHYKIVPDVLLVAKALGGGLLPLGVCISSPKAWNDDFGMLHSSTFANNQITCQVGIAVINKLLADDRALIKEVAAKGNYMINKLKEMAAQYPEVIKEVRGRGLMVGVEFYPLDDCGSFDMTYLSDRGGFTALLTGFLLNVYKIRLAPFLNTSTTLRLEPTLTITYEQIDYALQGLETICRILQQHDYSKLYRYLIGDYSQPKKIEDYRASTQKIIASRLPEASESTNKFAFIMHYPGVEDVILNNPSFASFSREEIYSLLKLESESLDPGITCHMPAIRSANGALAEGWLIGIPFGGRELMALSPKEAQEVVGAAVEMGRKLGARIIGLGALTSVVTRGGRTVTGHGVGITSGNSYTTLMAVEALFQGAELMHIYPLAAQGAIVGATGSIGRACALMMSEKICQLTLFGNPNHINSSKNRLELLVQDIMQYAGERLNKGEISGMSAWLYKVKGILARQNNQPILERMNSDEPIGTKFLAQLSEITGIINPICCCFDIEKYLPACDLIITASNSPDYLIKSSHLKTGAVICDVARPLDVYPEVYHERKDVLILEGGLVEYPEPICFGPNMGYRPGVNLACLSETILLALEGDYRDYSIGSRLSLETINYFRALAKKHGFKLAGLRVGNDELDEQYVEKIFYAAQAIREKEENSCPETPGA